MPRLRTYTSNIAVCAAWLALGNPAFGNSTHSSRQSDCRTSRLQEMEQCAFGCDHNNMPVAQRLPALEKATLGHESTGNFEKRMAVVERVLGKKHSQMMPPVAPQLDTGDHAPVAAPDIVVNNNSYLKARATEFGAAQPFRSPLSPYPLNAGQGYFQPGAHQNGWSSGQYAGQYMGQYNDTAAQCNPAAAQTAAASGDPGSNWRSSAGRFGVGLLNSGQYMPGAAGRTLNMLHCPLCRLLSF